MHTSLVTFVLGASLAAGAGDVRWHATPEHRAVAAVFSADGARVLLADERGGLASYDAASGKPVARHPGGRGKGFAARFSPDARRIAWADQGGGLILDDLTTHQRLAMLVMPFDGKRRARPFVVFSGDGAKVARSAGDVARVWDVATGQELATVRSAKPKGAPAGSELTGLALSPDGARLATGDAHALCVALVPTGTRRAASWVPAGALAFTPDGRHVVAAGPRSAVAAGAGFLTIWDSERLTPVGSLPGDPTWRVTQLAVSPDGRTLAFAYAAEARVMFWDLAGQKLTGSPDARVGRLAALVFDRSGKRLVAVGTGGAIALLDVP